LIKKKIQCCESQLKCYYSENVLFYLCMNNQLSDTCCGEVLVLV